ncbi:MAG TPA: TolC family protein, partial [Solimonas sp.]|nr:TolC family protein [Solimonas sp.]
MKTLQCLLPLLALLSLPASAEVLLLQDLAGDVPHAASVLQAQSELRGASSELERDRAEKGWRFTGAAGYGHIQDVVDEGRSISYQAAQAQLGLSYPLFGSAEKQTRAIQGAAGKVEEKRLRAEAARRLALLELETAYARYWGAQESLKLVDAYLGSEQMILPRLQQRQEKRLLLGSQMLDADAAYGRARSDRAQLLAVRNEARARLERLVGHALPGETEVRLALLPEPPEVPAAALPRHPELAALRAQRDASETQRQGTNWYGFDGAFNLNANTVHDTTNAETGSSAFVGLNFSAPVSLGGVRRAERGRLQAEVETLDLRYRQRRDELLAQMAGARDRLAQYREDVSVAAQRTRAAQEALRERRMRSGVFAQDGIEELAARLQAYYGQANSEIDARVKLWLANIDARAFAMAVSDAAAQAPPPSEESDIGTRLAEPIVALTQQVPPRSALPWKPAAARAQAPLPVPAGLPRWLVPPPDPAPIALRPQLQMEQAVLSVPVEQVPAPLLQAASPAPLMQPPAAAPAGALPVALVQQPAPPVG